ncbi:hypothetical protein IIC38_15705 [candidate division KSB1 bacterium]|nr:hypothetical protein [candidate division KSB1 bacterium]
MCSGLWPLITRIDLTIGWRLTKLMALRSSGIAELLRASASSLGFYLKALTIPQCMIIEIDTT